MTYIYYRYILILSNEREVSEMKNTYETIKILAEVDNETLERALKECKGSKEAKEKAMNKINEYKELKKIVGSWFA